MPRVKTEKIIYKKDNRVLLSFSYEVYVDNEGYFTTTIPKDVSELFHKAGIRLNTNRQNTIGYFSEKSLDALNADIKKTVEEYFSMEIVSEEIVIRYQIQTTCAYAMSIDGNFCPNPSEEWTSMGYGSEYKNRENKWREGNVPIHAMNKRPYGFLIYAKPFLKTTYKFRSGMIQKKYERVIESDTRTAEALKQGYHLRWLIDISTISECADVDLSEIEYNENTAKFFVDLLKSIFSINEQIKDFLTPEAIKTIAENNFNLKLLK